MRNFLSGVLASASVGVVAIACSSDGGVSKTEQVELALSQNLVIAGIFGGGGNSQAPFSHDYVMLFNRGTAPAPLNGLSIQYDNANGNFSATADVLALPNTSLQPGQYFLIQLNSNDTTVGSPLPTPDHTGTIGLSNNNGKVALVTAPLDACGATNDCPTTNIVDLVGYGSASSWEPTPSDAGSSAVPALSNTNGAIRKGGGCTETDDNANDFEVGAPVPKNTASTLAPCNAPPDSGSGGTGGTDAATGGAAGSATGGAAGSPTGGTSGAATGGAAGAATGGSGGASTGGSGGSATGGSGGASTGGSGGASTGGGGGTGAIGGFSGSGGKKNAPANDDGGCGCSTPGSNGTPLGAVALAGLVLALASRRRYS